MPIIYLPPAVGGAGSIGNALGGFLGNALSSYLDRQTFDSGIDKQIQARVDAGEVIKPDDPMMQVKNLVKSGVDPRQAMAFAQQLTQQRLASAHTKSLEGSEARAEQLFPIEQDYYRTRNLLQQKDIPLKDKQMAAMDLSNKLAEFKIQAAPLEMQASRTKLAQAQLEMQIAKEQNPLQKEMLKSRSELLRAQAGEAAAKVQIQKKLQPMIEDMLKEFTGSAGKEGAPEAGPASMTGGETPSARKIGDFSTQLTQARGQGGGDSPLQGMTSGDRLGAALDLAQGNLSGAASRIGQGTRPIEHKREQDPEQPKGITREVLTYADGSRKVVPNSELDERKPAPLPFQTGAAGVAQVEATVKTMGDLIDNVKSGKNQLSENVLSRINRGLVEQGFDPIGDKADARTALVTMRDHSVIAITNMLTGSRQTQALRDQVFKAMPSDRDTPNISSKKGAAMDLIMDLRVKEDVESALQNGWKIPPYEQERYKKNNLKDKSFSELQTKFLGVASKLPAPGKEISTQAEKSKTSSSSYSDDDINSAAEKYGITPEELKKFLEDQSSGGN